VSLPCHGADEGIVQCTQERTKHRVQQELEKCEPC
jgi:hypothetical protein